MVATLPSSITHNRVTGLPNVCPLHTDLMKDQKTGLKLLWSLKASLEPEKYTRRPLLREMGQHFPLNFPAADDDFIDEALSTGIYVMTDDSCPRVAAVLDNDSGLQAFALGRRGLRGDTLPHELIDILAFPTLFIASCGNEDPNTGRTLDDQENDHSLIKLFNSEFSASN